MDDKMIEKLLTEFVIRTAKHFNLSFEDALAAVMQSKVANDVAAFGNPENRSVEDLCQQLFHDISKGC